uniref:Uncharacterized protein n=1 Tax=Astyanax mexicanus TaxID=7994 RepID=A0A8B9RFS6_ASTMX
MAAASCCGPKLAACGLVLSIWAVIMLALLGIFFTTHSAVLFEDFPYFSFTSPFSVEIRCNKKQTWKKCSH